MYATKSTLSEKSLAWLQDLIQVNLDSRDGLREAIANLQPGFSPLAMLFARVADERADQAEELQDLVAANEEVPKHSGSMTAVAHRAWMDLRAALGGGEKALLEEAERGEDYVKGKYESALKDLYGCECSGVLRKQYEAVKAAHDRIRDRRDQCTARTCS